MLLQSSSPAVAFLGAEVFLAGAAAFLAGAAFLATAVAACLGAAACSTIQASASNSAERNQASVLTLVGAFLAGAAGAAGFLAGAAAFLGAAAAVAGGAFSFPAAPYHKYRWRQSVCERR